MSAANSYDEDLEDALPNENDFNTNMLQVLYYCLCSLC